MLHDSRTRGRAGLPRALSRRRRLPCGLLAVLVAVLFGGAYAAATPWTYVVSATFNGGSSASVVLGSQVEIAVTVRIIGSDGTNSWWCSTQYALLCPETGVHAEGCVPEPSPEGGCFCNWGCLTASWEWESTFTAKFTVTVPPVAGSYDVTLCALTQEGCAGMECPNAVKFTDAIAVTCGPGDAPTVELGAARVLTCTASSATLTAAVAGGKAPYAYLWTPGGATSQSLTVTSAGTYTLKVTGANGCSASDTVTVTADKTAPTVDAGEAQAISCATPSATLAATVTGGTAPYAFLWTPGDLKTQTISTTVPGTYTVTVTGANGCSASDAIIVSGPEQGTELIANGGFEEGLSGWRLYPDAGPLSSPAYSVSAFALLQESGVPCFDRGTSWLQSAAGGASGPTMLVQDVTSALTSGGTYRLSSWMRSDAGASSSPVVALLYVTADGTTPPNGVAAELRLPNDRVANEWTFLQSGEIVYSMPSGCTQAWIALTFTSSSGNAWWDNVSLVPLAE